MKNGKGGFGGLGPAISQRASGALLRLSQRIRNNDAKGYWNLCLDGYLHKTLGYRMGDDCILQGFPTNQNPQGDDGMGGWTSRRHARCHDRQFKCPGNPHDTNGLSVSSVTYQDLGGSFDEPSGNRVIKLGGQEDKPFTASQLERK